ncbi:hypothetical protein SLA2020_314780 [Shorea laevis]
MWGLPPLPFMGRLPLPPFFGPQLISFMGPPPHPPLFFEGGRFSGDQLHSFNHSHGAGANNIGKGAKLNY